MTDDSAPASARDDGPGSDDTRPESVQNVIARARRALHAGEVSVGDVVEALGRASFSPLLLVPALVVVTPASGIPLLSSICGISIALISIQMVVGRDHAWLPQWIMRRAVAEERLSRTFDFLTPIARFLDRITRVRFRPLVEKPFLIVPQLLAFLSGAVMPLLEVLPFTSSMLGATVSLLAVGMVTRDGLLVLIAIAIVVATVFTGHMLLTSDAVAATTGAVVGK